MLVTELLRPATHAEVMAASQQEQASLWQRLPAGQAFPATVSYSSTDGGPATAYRVGISAQATCSAATDPAVAKILNQYGCLTVLRATYTDPSGTVIGTIGVIVMRSADAAQSAAAQISASKPGKLRVAAFPGTIAGQFSDSAREQSRFDYSAGPYIFGYSGGYGDGRVTSYGGDAGEVATVDLGFGLVTALESRYALPKDPCKKADIRC